MEEDSEVLGVIITGEGRAFVARADISQMSGYGVKEVDYILIEHKNCLIRLKI